MCSTVAHYSVVCDHNEAAPVSSAPFAARRGAPEWWLLDYCSLSVGFHRTALGEGFFENLHAVSNLCAQTVVGGVVWHHLFVSKLYGAGLCLIVQQQGGLRQCSVCCCVSMGHSTHRSRHCVNRHLFLK